MRYCPKSLIDERIVGQHDGRAFKRKESKHMKKYSSIIYIVSLACAGLIFTGCATTQPSAATAPIPANSGHLLIYRVANFGSNMAMVVSVDGKDVGSFTEGRNYSGYLPAGQHTIIARVDPNHGRCAPARKTLTVQAGQTYSFTAGLVGREYDFGKEPGSVGASLLNRKVYLVGSVNLAVACWR